MPAHQIIPVKGIDTDTAPSLFSSEKAYLIKHGEIVSADNSSSATISNIRGNELSFIIPDLDDATKYTDPFNVSSPQVSDLQVIGTTNLRDDIVLFSTDEDGEPVNSYGQVWMLKYNYNNEIEWVHDLIEVGSNNFIVKVWDYEIDGNLSNMDSTQFGVGDQVLIGKTYTDTTPNPDVVYTKGEIWSFVSDGVWQKVTDLNVLKNKIIVANSQFAYILEPVLGSWDMTQLEDFPVGIQNGDRYMSNDLNCNIGTYVSSPSPHWEIISYPSNGFYTVFNLGDNTRYYTNTNGWDPTPSSTATEQYVWIGSDKTYLDFEGYIAGWHLFYDNTLMPGIHLKYFNELNFSTKYRIKAIGNVEDENIGKVYWVDSYNVLRHLNLYDEECYLTEVNQTDLVSNITFSQVKTNIVEGGIFKPGVVQYAYQLYKKNGPETSFSPASDLTSLTSSDMHNGDDKEFKGDKYSDPNIVGNTGKAVYVEIDDLDDNFEYIKVCSLYYDLIFSTPIISLVYDGIIPQSRKVTFNDSGGNNLRTYTLDEFTMIGGMYIKPNDLEVKDNRLIVANYKEEEYDVEYDARAYPWAHETSTFAQTIGESSEIYDTYTDPSNTNIIPENSNCWYNTTVGQWAFNADQKTLERGGTGPNVAFKIKVLPILIDSSKSQWDEGAKTYSSPNVTNLNLSSQLDSTFLDGASYTSYAGALTKSQLVGYQRGEKYRFGVVFFDVKGRRSPVKWISDIVMPTADITNSTTTYTINGINYVDFYPFRTVITTINGDKRLQQVETYANILYVEFTLNNTPLDAVSYQIVRVDRSEQDTSIVSSGYIIPTSQRWVAGDNFCHEWEDDWGTHHHADSIFPDGNITFHPVGSLLNVNNYRAWNP